MSALAGAGVALARPLVRSPACARDERTALRSPASGDGGSIAVRFSCGRDNDSPPLRTLDEEAELQGRRVRR